MNSKHKSCPELISTIRRVSTDGDDQIIGDRVTGIQVYAPDDKPAIVQIDVRDFKNADNLIVEIELSEFVSALSLATLNTEK